jgi:hypothetical protein
VLECSSDVLEGLRDSDSFVVRSPLLQNIDNSLWGIQGDNDMGSTAATYRCSAASHCRPAVAPHMSGTGIGGLACVDPGVEKHEVSDSKRLADFMNIRHGSQCVQRADGLSHTSL